MPKHYNDCIPTFGAETHRGAHPMNLWETLPVLEIDDLFRRPDNPSHAPNHSWEIAKRKMVNILVVEHERSARNRLKEILIKCGYDVIEAPNGREALETAVQKKIGGILLDVNLPVMDGWQVLSKLKENRQTRKIPVIMLTAYTSVENEATGMRMGVSHFIAKPWNAETLSIIVKVALRDAQSKVEETDPEPPEPMDVEPSSPSNPELPPLSAKVIGTGGRLTQLDRVLGGGIPLESLTLIEGPSGVGKSVLCQYLVYGAILSGLSLAYFTAKHTVDSLVEQMGSIGLDLSSRLQGDDIRTYPIQSPSAHDEPDSVLGELVADIERVAQNRGIIIVDDITETAQISRGQSVLGFFTSCQRQCSQGRTIVVVTRSSAFDGNLLPRLHGVCHAHISLGAEKMWDKLVNTLEVRKANKSDLNYHNKFSFQVEPAVGIKFVPMTRVKA